MSFTFFPKRSLPVIFFFFVTATFAQVKLPAIFSDNMVLQSGKPVAIWGQAAAGEQVSVTFGKQKKQTKADDAGKWQLVLSSLPPSAVPQDLFIKAGNTITLKNILVGEVWICSGQSNMDMTVAKEDRYWCGVVNEAEEVAAADYPLIRVFDTDFTPSATPLNDVVGKWEIISPQTVGHLSAVAYFFARDIQKKIKVPIGLITTAFGASTAEAWVREEALVNEPVCKPLVDSFKKKLNKYLADTVAKAKYITDQAKWKIEAEALKAAGKTVPRGPRNPDPVRDQHNAAVLWNGMVKPLVPYAIRGALWYQGESNSPTAKIYRQIMEILITDWRKQWGQGNFPFLYVQLANIGKTYDSLPAKGGSEAIKREAQLQNLSIPNTAMAVAIDNADPADMNNVHPKNKQEIGIRLALAALATVYEEKIVYSGPLYDKMEIAGNNIKLYFKHIGSGFMAKEGQLKGFTIAGEDKKFVWANAKIEGNTVIVSSPDITNPVAVRYGWGSNPPTSLYNKENLPASPFRTDSFEK
ncbi:MAG: sialate O-acetylesterase [Ferruginibacter sp.]|nr:sialate O-acetylesterase [Chitinophagaceae bacterium]